MRIRSILLIVSGAALGVALMISCGHNPPAADAADACNCPAAEPPLAGRIVQVAAQGSVPAQGVQGQAPQCPAGSTVIGGGCRLDALNTDVLLVENGPATAAREGASTIGWVCMWKNPTNAAVNATAIAICLTPAP